MEENQEKHHRKAEEIAFVLHRQVAADEKNGAGEDHGPDCRRQQEECDEQRPLVPVCAKENADLGTQRDQRIGDLTEGDKTESQTQRGDQNVEIQGVEAHDGS